MPRSRWLTLAIIAGGSMLLGLRRHLLSAQESYDLVKAAFLASGLRPICKIKKIENIYIGLSRKWAEQ